MATIGRVSLTIKVDGSDTSEVAVEYTIRFNALDVLGNLVHREQVRLFGDDPVFDDDLITLQNVQVRPNGQTTLERRIIRRVADSTLNEDRPFQDDEIYARVDLRNLDVPFPPVSRNSNVVTGSF